MIETMMEKARLTDAIAIKGLIDGYAAAGQMLPRSLSHIYENIRDFFVYRAEGAVVGCSALHILWGDQAELRAVAVREDMRGQGIGRRLVQACLDEARDLGLPEVFLLTYEPTIFEHLGFRRADIMTLSRKLWGECYKCPKYNPLIPCGEVAMKLQLTY